MRFHPWLPLTLILIGGASPLFSLTPHLVKDINPIPHEEGSEPSGFVTGLGLAFFSASDREAGTELWRTDGTLPGTFRLIDACPENAPAGLASRPSPIVPIFSWPPEPSERTSG